MTPTQKIFFFFGIAVFVFYLLMYLSYKFMDWFVKKYDKEQVVYVVNMKESQWPWPYTENF